MITRCFTGVSFIAGLCACGGARVAMPPPPAPELVLSHAPRALVSDGDAVYAANSDDGAVMRVPLDGGPASVLAAGPAVNLFVEGDEVFYLTARSVMRVPRTGGEPSVIAQGFHTSFALGADHSHVCWTLREAQSLGPPTVLLVCAPRAGGDAVEVSERGPDPDTRLAFDGDDVLWVREGALWRAPKAGGDARVIARGGFDALLGVQGGDAILLGENLMNRTISRVPLAGGAVVRMVQTDDAVGCAAVASDAVYYATQRHDADDVWGHGTPAGALYRLPVAGGAPALVAGRFARCDVATVAGASVYLGASMGLLRAPR